MANKKNNNGGPQTQDNNNNNSNNNKLGDTNIVMKLNVHCHGCMTRIRKSIIHVNGVRTVDFDGDMVKVQATAIVEPQKLKEKIERKTGKRIEIISPQPKQDKGNKNPPKQSDKPKEVQVKTVLLKISWHCYGCEVRIHKAISTFPGVYELSIDKEKDQVKVTGKMDPNKLVSELQKKLKRTVEILPEKKEKDKKEKEEKKENKEEKKKDNNGGGGGPKENGGGTHIDNIWFTGTGYWAVGSGPDPVYVYAPPLFSDENPNACSVM